LKEFVDSVIDYTLEINKYVITRMMLDMIEKTQNRKKSDKRYKKLLKQALMLPVPIKDIELDRENKRIIITIGEIK